MNEIVNKFLSPAENNIPEMHLRQPGFTYTAFKLRKNLERLRKKT